MNTKIVFSGDEVASRLFLKVHLTKFTPLKKTYLTIGIVSFILAVLCFFLFPKTEYWIVGLLFSLIMPFFYKSQRNSLIDKSVNKRATYDQEVNEP